MSALLFVVLFSQYSCSQGVDKTAQKEIDIEKYWTQGLAEINVYTLSQNRYQENHDGQLVSVFVREDFLHQKQVKNERYTDQNTTPILKNIQLRKFATGLYDYSMFTSTFTPLDRKQFPRTLKVSSSSQEWCGNMYLQFNYRDNSYKTELRSYFEGEGDQNVTINEGILEDELFNLLRMDPNLLPKGDFQVIPSANYIQLKHAKLTNVAAKGMLKDYDDKEFSGTNLKEYVLQMPSLKRTVRIVFENNAPYKIVGWLDSYPSAFDKKVRTTKITLQQQKMLDYWSKNSLKDVKLRKELGID